MKAPEHQAFGKERLWRHDWVSNQREAEKDGQSVAPAE